MKAEIDLCRMRDAINQKLNEILNTDKRIELISYNWLQTIRPGCNVETGCVTWKALYRIPCDANERFDIELIPHINDDRLVSATVIIRSNQNVIIVTLADDVSIKTHAYDSQERFDIDRNDPIITDDDRNNDIIHAITEAWELRFKEVN